jgi:hypothetical protein
MRIFLATLAVILLMAAAASAQQEVTGTYVTYGQEQTETKLPDGTSVSHATYGEFAATNDPNHPFNNQMGTCMSKNVPSEAGGSVVSAGACALSTPDGSTIWSWWRQDKSGTADCPNSCGTWGVVQGTGVFKGVTGTGQWETVATYPDQSSIGVWDLKYEKK